MNENNIETGYQPWSEKASKNTSIIISIIMWKTLRIIANFNKVFCLVAQSVQEKNNDKRGKNDWIFSHFIRFV